MRPLLTRVSLGRKSVHTSTDDTRGLLRALLRETAQSVAVVTALLPDPAPHQQSPTPTTTPTSTSTPASASTPTFHGATLSSFTSIALDPLPLVAFSLRVPSRMASALNAHVAPSPHAPSVHLIVNILSAAQPHLADRFARPDLHPRPFQDPRVPWTVSQEGLPVLSGVLGALSCRLVGPSLPLAHLSGVRRRAFDDEPVGEREDGGEGEVQQVSGGTGLASELFIARVLRVERVPSLEDDEQDGTGLHRLPLLYHRRRYTTVGDHTKP